MAIILDSLEKPLDDIALFVQLRIKVMLNPEIGFIGNTSKGSMLSDEKLHSLVDIFLPPRDASIAWSFLPEQALTVANSERVNHANALRF